MKLDMNPQIYSRYRRGPARPPLRTITEMAHEFGITRHQLAGLLGKDLSAPRPEMKCGTPGRINTWYKPAELRKWWEGRKKK